MVDTLTSGLGAARRGLGTGGISFARLVALRAGYVAAVVLVVYTLAFALVYALPSDPVAIMLERRSAGAGASSPEAIAALEARYGLDQPLLVRYVTTLGAFVRGDLGVSFQTGRPVASVLADVAPATIALGAVALLLAVPASALLALATSWHTGGRLHRALVGVPALVASIPAFWLGLLLLQLFAFELRWVPSTGGDLLLPAVALAVPVSAALTAVLVRSLDEASRAEWVRLLQSRGLPWHRIYLRHVARNAALPFVTLTGLTVAGVLGGAVITETVFSRSGLGRTLVSAVETQDAPVVLAIATLAAAVFALTNFLVDVTYPLLDPRLRQPVVTR